MEADDVRVDNKEGNGEAAVGTFTVEARVEGVGEAFAEALAVRLAAMGLTVWITEGKIEK